MYMLCQDTKMQSVCFRAHMMTAQAIFTFVKLKVLRTSQSSIYQFFSNNTFGKARQLQSSETHDLLPGHLKPQYADSA